MKRSIILSCLILITTGAAFAQKSNVLPKAYAFSRQLLGGVKPVIAPDESGKTVTRIASPSVQYFVYVVTKPGASFELQYLWIRGKLFSASVQKEKTPVIVVNNTMPGKRADTLIAATKNTVWHIQVKEVKSPATVSRPMQASIDKNELVVVYKDKSKTGMLTAKEIKKLTDVALQ